MRLGIDFDNTIACYDRAFSAHGVSQYKVPEVCAKSKQGVKKYLLEHGREEDWILLQGYVYGPGMTEATPYGGFCEFAEQAKLLGHDLFIISHKTKKPFRGPEYDLHAYSNKWLLDHKIIGHLIEARNIFFELTIGKKLDRIRQQNCGLFIDDLEKILKHERFPPEVRPILFDPNGKKQQSQMLERVGSWGEVAGIVPMSK
jgi:hypothetical protein